MGDTMGVAREVILEAGSFLTDNLGLELEGGAEAKGRNDFVTEVDRQSERLITERLLSEFPEIGVYAEESGAAGSTESFWVIDPLDGTTNFIHGYPAFAVSIALYERGETVLGLVYDPLKEELFEAAKNAGAFMNGSRIAVSSAKKLADALLGTGFPFSVPHFIDPYLMTFKELFLGSRGIRRAGSAALDLAHVAAGRLDGFWELYLKPWDMAAGALIVVESGGMVTDFFGGGEYLSAGHIVAAPEALLEEIVGVTSRVFTPEMIASLAVPFPR
jgi:myo-inositol-1(or 4)-monophosphatase